MQRPIKKPRKVAKRSAKPSNRVTKSRKMPKLGKAPERVEKPRELGASSTKMDEQKWRQITLRRSGGTNDIDAIALFEQVPERSDRDADPKTRLWCRGIVVDQSWLRVEHLTIESPFVLRLDFPQTEFERLPLHLYLERPSSVRTGSAWLLHGEDGKRVEASFAQYSDTQMSWADVARIERFYEK
jgi:hypothetical protein